MSDLLVHTIDTAPAASREALEGARRAFGFVPNLLGVLAASPAALRAYLSVSEAFNASAFSDVERQVVLLSVSAEHGCQYCMAAHSAAATAAEMPRDVLDALRSGEPIPDARLETLRRTTSMLVTSRGRLRDDGLAAFLAAGFTTAQLLEVIAGIAQKTISNYTNHIAVTPLDRRFDKFAWTPADAAQETARA
jgi:uncharacterized peroxidase-related enzyme